MTTERTQIRVLCIDDHPLLRQGIGALVGAQADMALVAQAATGQEGIREFRETRPDVTLLDLRLPDMSGVEVLRHVKETDPSVPVIRSLSELHGLLTLHG